jgi:hypothetical protein
VGRLDIHMKCAVLERNDTYMKYVFRRLFKQELTDASSVVYMKRNVLKMLRIRISSQNTTRTAMRLEQTCLRVSNEATSRRRKPQQIPNGLRCSGRLVRLAVCVHSYLGGCFPEDEVLGEKLLRRLLSDSGQRQSPSEARGI